MYKKRINALRKYRVLGLTLLELLISITISTLLLIFISTIYLACEAGHKLQKNLKSVTYGFKIASGVLNNDLPLAGYIGCPSLNSSIPLRNSTNYSLTSQNKIEVFTEREGGSVISVRHRSLESAMLLSSMERFDEIDLPPEFKVTVGDVLIISDCRSVDIFEVSQVIETSFHQQRIISTQPLQRKYSYQAEVGFMEVNSYWVDKNYVFKQMDIKRHITPILDEVRGMHVLLNIQGESHFRELPSLKCDAGSKISGLLIQWEWLVGGNLKRIDEFIRL